MFYPVVRRTKANASGSTKFITALDIGPLSLLTGESSVKVKIKEAARDIKEISLEEGDYYEKSGDGTQDNIRHYHGSCAEEKSAADKLTEDLKSKLIEAQSTIIKLMNERDNKQ